MNSFFLFYYFFINYKGILFTEMVRSVIKCHQPFKGTLPKYNLQENYAISLNVITFSNYFIQFRLWLR